MTSMNVSLTPELIEMVQSKVISGEYTDASEVISEALRQLDISEQALYKHKLARLREALEPGLKDLDMGRFSEYSLETLMAELDNEHPAS